MKLLLSSLALLLLTGCGQQPFNLEDYHSRHLVECEKIITDSNWLNCIKQGSVYSITCKRLGDLGLNKQTGTLQYNCELENTRVIFLEPNTSH